MHTDNNAGGVQIYRDLEPPPWLALNGAFALIFTKGYHRIPRIVTVKRKENGKIELPGGGINQGEESIQGMRRELREEIGFCPDGEFFLAGKFTQKVPLRDNQGRILRDEAGNVTRLFTGSVDLWLYSRILNGKEILRAFSPDTEEVQSIHLMDSSAIAQIGLHKGTMLGHLRMIASFMSSREKLIGQSQEWARKCSMAPIEGALKDPVIWGGRTY